MNKNLGTKFNVEINHIHIDCKSFTSRITYVVLHDYSITQITGLQSTGGLTQFMFNFFA